MAGTDPPSPAEADTSRRIGDGQRLVSAQQREQAEGHATAVAASGLLRRPGR